jgi:drug/metabolite transporter (DMT)-like permease
VGGVAELPLLLVLLGVGATDAAAEVCFATAGLHGHLSVVAVLAGLYPVVTVLLTLLVLRERAHPVQAVSAAAALAGVLLFAAA